MLDENNTLLDIYKRAFLRPLDASQPDEETGLVFPTGRIDLEESSRRGRRLDMREPQRLFIMCKIAVGKPTSQGR